MRYGNFFVFAFFVASGICLFFGNVNTAHAQTATPTPTVDFCTEFPEDITCVTPTPTEIILPTATASAYVNIDIASTSALAQGVHDLTWIGLNIAIIIVICLGFIIGAMWFFLT